MVTKRKLQSFIVKVQLSITTTESKRQMLIYDKNREYMYEGEATSEVIESMQPKDGSYSFLKAYFHAHLIDDPNKKGAVRIVLDKYADPQPW